MNRVISLLLFLASWQLGVAQGSLDKLEKAYLFGHNYVRVSDWAKLYGFEIRGTSRDKEVQVKTRWSTLSFTGDSKRAEINGVGITLSAPLLLKSGTAWLSALDLKTAVQPILFPPQVKKGDAIRTICLDPGHGGKDPGEQSGRNQEKKYTLLLAQELEKQLKEAGFKVVLTRTSDRFVDVYDRPPIALRNGADLFVSLHFNSVVGEARGLEVYCLTPEGASSSNSKGEGATNTSFEGNRQNDENALLAYYVQKNLLKATGMEDRGVKRARFAVLRKAQMPAILVEGGFMSDASDANRIYSTAQRRQMAAAIVDGIRNYKKIVER